MTDNIVANSGDGLGAGFKTDEFSANVHVPYSKLMFGPDNTFTIVGLTNGIPIQNETGGSIVVDLGSNNDVTVSSGTMTVDLGATDNAVLDSLKTVLDTIKVDTEAIETAVEGTLTVTGSVVADLGANNDVTVTGTVTADAGTNLNTSALLTTAAHDNAFGTAGSADAQVRSIQGIASGTPVEVDLGSNNDVTVTSGTITANLGATDNAVLDVIEVNTSEAASFYRNVDANAEAEIKGSAGVLHWLHCMNMTAAVAYVHLYNATTASVTPGTTTPDLTFPLPTQGDTNGAGFNLPLGPNGQNFSTAITIVVTTTIDGGTGDPGTNGVFVNAGYT